MKSSLAMHNTFFFAKGVYRWGQDLFKLWRWIAGTEVHNLNLESSHCFCPAFSGFPVWLIRTIECPNYTKELKYFVSSLISWYYEWWDIATSLRTMPKHGGRRRGIVYRTKGKITSCKSLWSLRRSFCLFEAEAESLFKMHQMFECEVRSWQHLILCGDIQSTASQMLSVFTWEGFDPKT